MPNNGVGNPAGSSGYDSSGNLQFLDSAGNVIATFDAINRRLTIPSGASLTGAGASVSVASPDGVTLDALGAANSLEVIANSIGAARLAKLTTGDLTPGPEVVLVFDVADHATQNVDKIIAVAMTVTSVTVIANGTNGANANTVQLDNGTGGNHITDAISTNGKSAGDVVNAISISPTYWAIAAGATLRIVQTRAGGVQAFRVIVKGFLA